MPKDFDIRFGTGFKGLGFKVLNGKDGLRAVKAFAFLPFCCGKPLGRDALFLQGLVPFGKNVVRINLSWNVFCHIQ